MKNPLKLLQSRIGEFAEHSTEATCACAIMMVQGQLMLLSAAHWVIAIQTGLIAGVISTLLIIIGRATKPWIISAVLGLVTACVDFFVHASEFGPVFIEPLLTGIGAGLLSLIVTTIIRYLYRQLRSRSAEPDQPHP
jgi:hypothetical protein